MKEPISIVEAKIVASENEAKRMLRRLESAMVECGYVRDGYHRPDGLGGPSRRYQRAIFWNGEKISIARGANYDPGVVYNMTTDELIYVAHNLSGFFDALEEGSRWKLREVQAATAKIQEMIEQMKADPRPAVAEDA